MNKDDKLRFGEMSKIIKAMSHPTRLFIVDKLKERKFCVCELTEMVGSDISTVSRHLTVLKNAGIIYDEKIKNNVYYDLRCPCISNFYSCVITIINIQKDEQNNKKYVVPEIKYD